MKLWASKVETTSSPAESSLPEIDSTSTRARWRDNREEDDMIFARSSVSSCEIVCWSVDLSSFGKCVALLELKSNTVVAKVFKTRMISPALRRLH